MENDAFGMDLLVLNHKKFPDKFLIWKHKVIWKPKELFKTGGIFLKILEILLKTGGIFKNRWNQKPVEFFLSKKNGGIIPPVPPVSGGSKTPCYKLKKKSTNL